MKQSNIDFLLQMTKDYLEGKIDCTTYGLDFTYEVESRYRRMVKEDKDMAELIYDCLVEDGASFYHDLAKREFKANIRKQYLYIEDIYRGRIDLT